MIQFRVLFTCLFKYKRTYNFKLQKSFSNYTRSWNVLFFGTDDFSVETLKKLHGENSSLVKSLEIVTSDKRVTAVKKFAVDHHLPVHDWPLEIPKGKYDVGVVASFGHLIPEKIISAFEWGIINVHASLLPRWRGAAPVIHAVLNGDSITGISIMKIEPKHFDVGNILMQESCPIPEGITARNLTVQLAQQGADMLIKCLENLPENLKKSIPQSSLQMDVTKAPKITSKMAQINWEQSSEQLWRRYRALTGYFHLETCFSSRKVKLDEMLPPAFINTLRIDDLWKSSNMPVAATPGSIYVHRKRRIVCTRCQDHWVGFQLASVKGYKWMNALEFYNGFITKVPSIQWRFNNEIETTNKCGIKTNCK